MSRGLFMEIRISFIIIFTIIIHIVGTVAYSVRLVGINTGRIAVAASLFNVMALGARLSVALQAFFLARFIERDIPEMSHSGIFYFILILAASVVGTLAGGILIPTFQNILTGLVNRFNETKSVSRIIFHSFNNLGIYQIRKNLKIPAKKNFDHLKEFKMMPRRILILNTIVTAILTVGPIASLYAAATHPQFRLTSVALVPLITGFATIALVIFIDPYFSMLTDDIICGKKDISVFHKSMIWLTVTRVLGTFSAVFLLTPFSKLITYLAECLVLFGF